MAFTKSILPLHRILWWKKKIEGMHSGPRDITEMIMKFNAIGSWVFHVRCYSTRNRLHRWISFFFMLAFSQYIQLNRRSSECSTFYELMVGFGTFTLFFWKFYFLHLNTIYCYRIETYVLHSRRFYFFFTEFWTYRVRTKRNKALQSVTKWVK